MEITPPIILTIAGSDSSAGAGIQADLKTIHALGGYAATAITAITAQNTMGVKDVMPISSDMVRKQIDAVLGDMSISAIKIGMVCNPFIISAIASALEGKSIPMVIDPIICSTSGKLLLGAESIESLKMLLFPVATLITPNLPEASVLLGKTIQRKDEMKEAAQQLAETYHTSVLLKGGHLESETSTDCLYHQGECIFFTHPMIKTPNLHGTGCTLSSAIATFIAKGYALPIAVERAKEYLTSAILGGIHLKVGHGNGPLQHFIQKEYE